MKLKIKIGVLLLIFFLFLLFMELYVTSVILILILTISYYLNKHIKRKVTNFRKRMCIDFMNDNRRNFDLIKIGMPFVSGSEKFGKSVLDLTSQNQSMLATYLFLIHNFSYLSEDSDSQIEIKLNLDSRNRISLSEISCFHIVLLKSLGIKNLYWLYNFPIIYRFVPLRVNYNLSEQDIKNQISKFCVDRNINFKYI